MLAAAANLVILSTLLLVSLYATHQVGGADFYAGPDVTAAQIIEARGYRARELYFNTTDGYQLRLTRATNPLINGGQRGADHRVPILFVHGVIEGCSIFFVNSFNVTSPSDYSWLNLTEGNQTNGIPSSARSLPLLALDFGHEIYCLDRRGFPGSQVRYLDNGTTRIGPQTAPQAPQAEQQQQQQQTSSPLSQMLGLDLNAVTGFPANFFNFSSDQVEFSFDPRFWNFSYDQQAAYDLPQAIDLVLNLTGRRRLATVTHSAGGAIFLMALSKRPQLADKLAANVLWSESFTLGRGDFFNLVLATRPLFERYVGSFPPSFASAQIQSFLDLVCATSAAQRTLCESLFDLVLGPSGGRAPIRPQFINTLFRGTGSHEFAQNFQNIDFGGQMHQYDFGPDGNQAAYGQPVPPIYNASAITSRVLSFYASPSDYLVSQADVEASASLLSVPHKLTRINATLNHLGYFFHDDNAQMVIVPSLQDIHRMSATGQANQ